MRRRGARRVADLRGLLRHMPSLRLPGHEGTTRLAPVCCNVEGMRPELLRRLEEVVWVDPDRLSGTPCFRGTRIPVRMLIDHLTAGFSLDEFLETVPSLERGQAQRFLELAGEQMNECASSLTSV